jgi:endonuclease YncB( thermonuclease family)
MGYSKLLKKASLVGAFFVSVVWLGPAQAFCPMPDGLPSVGVQRVVDGDTLRLADGRSVRLIGLNTPELGRQNRSAEPFAEVARRRLQELVAASDGRVRLQVGSQAKDHYGRTLAHAYDVHGANLEARMLAEGLGYWLAMAPNLALVDCQQAAERSARQARLGLWRQSQVQTPGQLRRGGFALIRGDVVRVERNRGGVWLEMGDSLVLQVRAELVGNFDVRQLQGLAGRTVEARGWVADRAQRGGLKAHQARWMLPLTDNAMLEVLP